MQPADRVGLAQAQRPGLGRVGLTALVVDLGHRQHHRAAGPAQRAGHHQVGLGGAGARVEHEQHQVGGHHGLLGLPGHHRLQAGRVRFPAAGVDQGELPAAPVGVVGDPVPGHAGHVLHHRLAAAEDPVHQGGLAHVRDARRRPPPAAPASGVGSPVGGIGRHRPDRASGIRSVGSVMAQARSAVLTARKASSASSSTTSSMLSSEVSTSVAPSGRRSGLAARLESKSSRRRNDWLIRRQVGLTQLAGPPPGPDVLAGGQVHLQLGIRPDHRADVAALGDGRRRGR